MLISEHDPFRPIDWRYRRAEWLRTSGRHVRKDRECPYIALAKKFLAAKERCDSDIDEERLAKRMPGIYFAYRIFNRHDTNDRYVIEARILANQDQRVIAKRQNTTPEVIFWFEKLFFDVRDKLDCRDYVINRVLGPSAHRGISERDFDILLKLYALIGGPLVVDALIEMDQGDNNKPGDKREVSAFFCKDSADTTKRKAAIAARTLPINTHTQLLIIEAHHRLLDIERQQETSSDTGNLLINNIHATLKAVPFHTTENYEAPGVVKKYEKLNVELRADELITAGVGIDPGIDEDLKLYRFPELTEGENNA